VNRFKKDMDIVKIRDYYEKGCTKKVEEDIEKMTI
jgi:hypothetical protein